MDTLQDEENEPARVELTQDLFLAGRLRLTQPAKGYRAGTDALLLAAAARDDAEAAHQIADAGAGVGTVGLALALDRRAGGPASITLIERDPVFTACARQNISDAALPEAEINLEEVDCSTGPPCVAGQRSPIRPLIWFVTNPPYDQALRGRRTPNMLKLAAHAMRGGDLRDWLAACARLLKQGGILAMVHRADLLAKSWQPYLRVWAASRSGRSMPEAGMRRRGSLFARRRGIACAARHPAAAHPAMTMTAASLPRRRPSMRGGPQVRLRP